MDKPEHTPAMDGGAITRHLTLADLPGVCRLQARVFGPGRFARTAYRIREGTPQVSPFCRGAFIGPALIASLRMTPVAIGASRPHLLLGPLAVAPEFSGQGFGRRLIAEALADGKARGMGIVTLVGDLPYYGRFGFSPVRPGTILFPGPVNPGRILACELTPGTLTAATGVVTAIDM